MHRIKDGFNIYIFEKKLVNSQHRVKVYGKMTLANDLETKIEKHHIHQT